MMSATLEGVEKPISPKRAAAELEAVLSKSLFLSTPEESDFEGSIYSVNESDISRDSSALDWAHPDNFRLPPRSVSTPFPRRHLERSQSPSSVGESPIGWSERPSFRDRSKSLGSVTSDEMHRIAQDIRSRSLMDDDSATVASSAVACSTVSSSADTSGERFTFIANIGDVNNDTSYDTAGSVDSRKSKRSRQSRRSARSRKRGDSLEREISIMILQTAGQGAEDAHFLVTTEPEVKSPVKSAEEILGDLFVSQDTSLEPISLEDGATEFRTFFSEDEPASPLSKPLFVEDEPMLSPSSEAALIDSKDSGDSDESIFTFHPGDGEKKEDEEEYQMPSYAANYINKQGKKKVSAIISEAPSQDSLFAFSVTSDITEDTARGKELLFPEDALKEELPIGSRWSPTNESSKENEQPTTPERFVPQPRPAFNELSVDRPSTTQEHSDDQVEPQDVLRPSSSADGSTDRYQIEMDFAGGTPSVGALRSFVPVSDGTSEVQQALVEVMSPATSEKDFDGDYNLEREDYFVNEEQDDREKAKVSQGCRPIPRRRPGPCSS